MPEKIDTSRIELEGRCQAGEQWACIQLKNLDQINKPVPTIGFAEGGVVDARALGTPPPDVRDPIARDPIPSEEGSDVDFNKEEEQALLELLKSDPKWMTIFEKLLRQQDVEEAPEDLPPQMFRNGGRVLGAGSETSDSIPARVSDGEFIFTAKAVKQLGLDRLESMMSKAEENFDSAGATGQQMRELLS